MADPIERVEAPPTEAVSNINAGSCLASGDVMPHNAYSNNTADSKLPGFVIDCPSSSKPSQWADSADPAQTRDATNNGQNRKETKVMEGDPSNTTFRERTADGYKETTTERGVTTNTEHHDSANGWSEHVASDTAMGRTTTDRHYDQNTGRTTEDSTDPDGSRTHRVTEANGNYHEMRTDKLTGAVLTTDHDAASGRTHEVMQEPDLQGRLQVSLVSDKNEKTGESTEYDFGNPGLGMPQSENVSVTKTDRDGQATVSYVSRLDQMFKGYNGVPEHPRRIDIKAMNR